MLIINQTTSIKSTVKTLGDRICCKINGNSLDLGRLRRTWWAIMSRASPTTIRTATEIHLNCQ